MDGALEVIDVLADSGLEGAVTWLLRLAGLLSVLAGLGLVLLVVPSVMLAIAEVA